jgi:sodium-dependent dicarboxylate transporter 2/3/5
LALAEQLNIHPLFLALPATIAPSFAFMLPVATPPNAIVYETGVIKTWEMVGGVFVYIGGAR